MPEWLSTQTGPVQAASAVIQAIGAIAQVVLAAALVWVTWQYARTTRAIASETRAAAAASDRMVGEMQRQALAAVRPVVTFTLSPGSTTNQFEVRIRNVGTGPALHLKTDIVNSPLPEGFPAASLREYQEPFVLAVGEDLRWGYFDPRSRRGQTEIDQTPLTSRGLAGRLTALYRDVHGQWFMSGADLQCTSNANPSAGYAVSLRLGPLHVEAVPVGPADA